MQRPSLSEQLFQPSLLQRLVGANRDAIAPTTNLLNGEPMTGDRLAHLNLKLGSWRDRVGPTIAFQRRDAESCGLVDGFGGHLHRMPNAGRTGKADRTRPEGHGGSAYHIRFMFAYRCRARATGLRSEECRALACLYSAVQRSSSARGRLGSPLRAVCISKHPLDPLSP
jgi:hypothetical protein